MRSARHFCAKNAAIFLFGGSGALRGFHDGRAARLAALVCSPKTVPPVAQVLDCSGQKLGQGRRLAMKKSYTPEGIVRILQDVQAQLAAGASLREVARQLGVNPGTLCRWQRRYGGVQIDEAWRMFLLEK